MVSASYKLIAVAGIGLLAGQLLAQPPDFNPFVKQGPPRSPEELMRREFAKVWERAQKNPDPEDTARHLEKMREKLDREFGVQLSEKVTQKYLMTADKATVYYREQAARPFGPLPQSLAKPRPPERRTIPAPLPTQWVISHGPHYLDGLPDWYATRDQNHDGQLGLYEWPRTEFPEFVKMDANDDGFLVQQEVLRFLEHPADATAQMPIVLSRSLVTPASTLPPSGPPISNQPTELVRKPTSPVSRPAISEPIGRIQPSGTSEEMMKREMFKRFAKKAKGATQGDEDKKKRKLRAMFGKGFGPALSKKFDR